MKSPAFQFYAAEFLADENVVLMSNQEVGCYIKLMAYCWREGSIPSDIAKIARLCGEDGSAMAQLWLSIKQCFELANGSHDRLTHPRLEKEREKQSEFKKERAESGKKGAAARWDKAKKDGEANSSAIGSATEQPMAIDGSSSSTSSSSIHTPTRAGEISRLMRQYTISATPAHPTVIAIAEQDVALETIEAACKEAREKKPNESISAAYIAKKLEGWKQSAAAVNVAGATVREMKPPDDWFRSQQGIERKGRELGMVARGSESYDSFRERIREELKKRERGAAA